MVRILLAALLSALVVAPPAAHADDTTPLVWESVTNVLVPTGDGGWYPAMVLQGPSRPLTAAEVGMISQWNDSDARYGGAPTILLSWPDTWAPASPAPLQGMKIRPPQP